MSGELAHWPGIARSWHLVGPPLRPSPEEIELFERSIMHWAQGVPGAQRSQEAQEIQALVLGVTPELFLLRWPEATVVRALDASSEMINVVWQGPEGSAVSGSWTAAPIAQASQHVIVCDGVSGC